MNIERNGILRVINRLAVVGLLSMLVGVFGAAAASADTTPYPAPPVTSSVSAVVSTSATAVAPTQTGRPGGAAATTAPDQAGSDDDSLASTGAGMDLTLAVVVGAMVLLTGVALVVVGGRRIRRHSH